MVPGVAGFGHNSRPGEPMLPLKVLLVAIPEGSNPELRVLSARAEPLGPLDIAPVPTVRVPERLEHPRGASRRGAAGVEAAGPGSVQEYDEVSVRDETIYGRDADFPATPVRLGRTGYLREQRFVEVLYTPVAFNAARRRASFFPDVQLEILFAGAPSGAFAVRSRPDPL
ncbi:MAG TPA: C25 family peptidase propeptide domain-containing protein, partial [Candidatus Dormibacteraeota bacterium]|nr:C25 family peptidase propeptide domain-containing protein [Candidatus Dormibacteraeota bacterium]